VAQYPKVKHTDNDTRISLVRKKESGVLVTLEQTSVTSKSDFRLG